MPKKLMLVAEAGLDTAVAIACAVADPNLDLLLVAGAAGIEDPASTDSHLHALLECLDPPRLPRYGGALPPPGGQESCTQQKLGLGRAGLPCCTLHNLHPGDKLLVEAARQAPGEITLLTLGPLTPVARAMDRDGEFLRLLKSLIIVGGAGPGIGNAGPVSEYHFACDPAAARQILAAATAKTLLPLEVCQADLFAPTDLNRLAQGHSPVARVLQKVFPLGIHDLAQEQGLEGMYLADVFGVAYVAQPHVFKSRPATVDVETRGELTKGMAVIDHRRSRRPPNVDWCTEANATQVREYLYATLHRA